MRGQLDKALAKCPWCKPVDIEIFGGTFDPALLRFPWNLVPALSMMPPSDIRDWTAIRTWASNLADKFHHGSPERWDNEKAAIAKVLSREGESSVCYQLSMPIRREKSPAVLRH